LSNQNIIIIIIIIIIASKYLERKGGIYGMEEKMVGSLCPKRKALKKRPHTIQTHDKY
jgi:hypothetical protein